MPTLATSGQRICYFRRKAQMTLRTLSETNVTEATLRSLLRPALPGGCRLAGFRALVFRRLPQILLLTTRLLFNALLFIREIFIIALLAVAHRRFSLSSKR